MERIDNLFDLLYVKESTRKLIDEINALDIELLNKCIDDVTYPYVADNMATRDCTEDYVSLTFYGDVDIYKAIDDIKNELISELGCSELVLNKVIIVEEVDSTTIRFWNKYN